MDNFRNIKTKKDSTSNESAKTIKNNTQQLGNNSSSNTNKNNNTYQPRNLPVLEDIIKSNEKLTLTQNENTKRKNKSQGKEESKQDSSKKSKKDSKNTKKHKKSVKIRKPRKEQEIGGTIKVVGKISNKLQYLIAKLGQNSAKENISNTRKEYVYGNSVKRALEKMKKIKEEEEVKKKTFHKTRFLRANISDSDEGKSQDSSLNKKRNFKRKAGDDNMEEDEEEEEYEDEFEENCKNKIKRKKRKSMPELKLERIINYKDLLTNQEKKKMKKRKKEDKTIKLSKEHYAENGDNSSHDSSHKKKKNKKNKKENISKRSSFELSGESKDKINEKTDEQKKKEMKKEKTFNFSESEKSEEEQDNNEEPMENEQITQHKSGKGYILTKYKNVKNMLSTTSSQSSCSKFNPLIEKNENLSDHYDGVKNSENNPINITNQKKDELDDQGMLLNQEKLVKKIEYDKFSYKQYIVKNYHPKPVTIWKKQIKKYVLCRQVNFSLISKISKKVENKRIVKFNINSNVINTKKNNVNNKSGSRNSVANSINNNSLFNFKNKYNINKLEESFPSIKKMTNTYLIEDKKNINKEFSNKSKSNQSNLSPGDSSFNDFNKKLNEINNNIISIKRKRLSLYEAFNKRRLNLDSQDNDRISPNPSENNSKVKLYRSGSKKLMNKDIGNKLESIPEKEKVEDLIKETHFGVKYIVFQNKNELKTIYKKEKWKLSISKIVSIFLKAIKKIEVKNKNNEKNINDNNIKNKAILEKVHKNKFDIENNKIEKTSLNYMTNKNNKYKFNDFSNENNENNEDIETNNNNNIQKNLNNKFNNETLNKKEELQKLNKKEQKKHNFNEQFFMNFDSSIYYDKETKRSDKDTIKNTYNEGNLNYSNYNYGNYYLSDNKYKRRDIKTLTIQARKVRINKENIFEEKEKKIRRVKSKKAKIRIFKSVKDEPNLIEDERRRKGNLYDYYIGKSPKKTKNYSKSQKSKDKEEDTLNSRIQKNDNIKYVYKTINHKTRSLNNTTIKYVDKTFMNNSTSKKQIRQKKKIYYIGKNTNLISPYRKRLFKAIFNKNNISQTNTTKNKKDTVNKSMLELRRKNDLKVKVNPSKEMIGIDAIKSKMKKKLIEINNKLIDAVDYYNGPIDISCISLKNYTQTIEDLEQRALKNGYTCIKSETNYYELSNGLNIFLVEIVKIRNNMLYYLIVKK